MKYYILLRCFLDDALGICGTEILDSEFGLTRYSTTEGEILRNDYLQLFRFEASSDGKPLDFLSGNLSWYLVSERTKKILESICLKSELQILSESIKNFVNIDSDYFLLNPLVLLKCIDPKKSSIKYNPSDRGGEYISTIYDMVLIKTAIPKDANIFLLEECRSYLIVSENIVEKFLQSNITGCSFKQVSVE